MCFFIFRLRCIYVYYHICSGLKYVEAGITFIGFKPKDKHIEEKLSDHMKFLKETAMDIISNGFERRKLYKENLILSKEKKINDYAKVIQGAFYRYRHRIYFYDIWIAKRHVSCGLVLQRYVVFIFILIRTLFQF
jgi:hypothetical protein